MIRSAVVTRARSLAARGLAAGLLVVVAAFLVLPLQAVTLVDNSSEDTSAQMTVGGDSNVRQAQKFTVPTGQNYSLADVTIRVSTRSSDGLVVSIRDGSAADPPDTALYTLIDPASPGTGDQVYSAPAGAVLEGGNNYFVMLQRAQNTGTSSQVRGTNANGQSGETGWSIANIRRERSSGTWSDDTNALKIRIRGAVYTNAAPIFTNGGSTSRDFNETIGDVAVTTASNIGTAVGATDSNNDTLAYSLEGADAARFGIITTTGQLRTRAGEKYDFEAQPSYAVRIRVVDGNGGADTIDVTVNVNNNSGETPLEPAAPMVTTTPGSMTGLDVSWVAPGNSGRPAITGNDLRYRAGAGGGWTDGPQGVTGTSASITLFLSRSTVSFSKPANSGIVFSNPTNLGSDCKTLKVIGLYVLQFQPEPVPGRNGTE